MTMCYAQHMAHGAEHNVMFNGINAMCNAIAVTNYCNGMHWACIYIACNDIAMKISLHITHNYHYIGAARSTWR
jgi:hypothetical protein